MEYTRNVIGQRDAGHILYNPDAPTLVIVPLTCRIPDRTTGQPTLSGKMQLTITPGSLAERIYGRTEAAEEYHCNNGLNREFQGTIDAAGLRIVGLDDEGEARIVELPTHRFLMATLFIPQLSSTPEEPHPLIVAFLQAAVERKQEARTAVRAS